MLDVGKLDANNRDAEDRLLPQFNGIETRALGIAPPRLTSSTGDGVTGKTGAKNDLRFAPAHRHFHFVAEPLFIQDVLEPGGARHVVPFDLEDQVAGLEARL